jgi:hypothetical protein
MAVMERDAWTDKRLNDLDGKVDEGFKEMRTEFKAVRAEIQKESKALRAEVQEELRGIRSEMGAFNRSTTQILWAIVGTIFLGFMGTIAALFTLV